MYHTIACLTVPKLSYLGEHSEVSQVFLVKPCSTQGTNANYMQPRDFHEKCRQQQNFDSDPKEAWHYNHVTFTPIAKNFMLYCRLIYMLSMLYVRLTIKVKLGISEIFKVGWYPHKITGSRRLNQLHVFNKQTIFLKNCTFNF